MPWAKKPLIRKVCGCCGKEVWIKRAKGKRFRYCSNACKWKAKEQQIPHNKLTIHKRVFVACSSVFCQRGKFLTPFWAKKKRKDHFCCRACHMYYKSKQYQLDLLTLQERKQEDTKRSIWRL